MKKEELLKLIPEMDEETAQKVEKATEDEIATSYVTLTRFNEVNTAKKKAEKDAAEQGRQLEELQNSAGDTAELLRQNAELQKQIEADKVAYEADRRQWRDERQAEDLLRDARAINVKAAMGLLTDFISSAERDKDGSIKGLDEKVQELVTGEGTAFLFQTKSEPKAPTFKGVKLGEASDGIPNDENQPPKTLAEAVERGLEKQQTKENE